MESQKKHEQKNPKPLKKQIFSFKWGLNGAISVRFIEDPTASSCTAGCHSSAEEGERAVPHEVRAGPEPLNAGLIGMGSECKVVSFFFWGGIWRYEHDQNRMNIIMFNWR